MAKIGIYEGFGAKRGRKRKSSRKSHRKSHKRSRGGKAHTPQALKFKRAVAECGKKHLPAGTTIHAAQKALGKCIKSYYK